MAVAEQKNQFVTVTEGITDEDTGASETRTLEIEGGPTKVPELKSELGIAADDALWVVEKNGKKKALADHETHNVKEGDHFEALVKGGVS
jgi:sulfur carrier protein ThiS